MKKIITRAIYTLHLLIIVGLFALQRLSTTKAGVNHHLIARKHQLSQNLFSKPNLQILSIIVIILLISSLIWLIFSLLKKRKIVDIIILLIIEISILAFINIPLLHNFNSSYYIIPSLIIMTLLQIASCLIKVRKIT